MANDDAFSSLLLGPGILIMALLAIATVFIYKRMTMTTQTSNANSHHNHLKNIWEERRRPNGSLSSNSGKAIPGDKPFGSTYYYAHNNPNATGGYKDGLQMEDYTMNQPRLLSKGGVIVPPESNTVQTARRVEYPTIATAINREKGNVPIRNDSSKRISKFLWDDPGDANGIATIRIDTLPGSAGISETIAWRDANIRDISTTLVNGGLLVVLESENGAKYRLHIPKLYGQVAEVKKVAKASRLLIRLYKKKNRMNPWDKKNLQAWPHP
jgi:hypothetical protein